MLIHRGQPLGMLDQGLGSMLRVSERGWRGRQVVKSCLTALIVGWRNDDVDHYRD
jgi:hypothetical protein